MKKPENIRDLRSDRPGLKEYGAGRSGGLRNARRNFRDVFTPCAVTSSLLKTFHLAAENALPGDVILISPACSSFDQFQQNQGLEKLRTSAANALAPTIGSRITVAHPYMQAVAKTRHIQTDGFEINLRFAPGFFEEKPRRKKQPKTYLINERTPTSVKR